jgi:tetratricopeptide (TPR) repeat protein
VAIAIGLIPRLGVWRARDLLWQRRYEAVPNWLAIGSVFGDSAETWRLRSRLSRHLLDLDGAGQALDAARAAGLSHAAYGKEQLLLRAQAGRLENLEPTIYQWMQDAGEDAAELCEAYANGLLINNRPDDALAIFDVWIKEYPNDPQPHVSRGRWFESRQQIDEAEAAYQAALERDPRFAPAHYALGRLNLNRQKMEAALANFEQAEQLLEHRAAPGLGIARSRQALGQIEDARAILDEIVRLPRDDVQLSFVLVQDPDPTRPAERLLGEILAGLGEYAEALPHLEAALEIEPKSSSLRYLKAQALQSMSREDEARKLFEEIAADRAAIDEADRIIDRIKARPGDPWVDERFRIGELYLKHDSAYRAEYWLKSVLVYDPNHAEAHALLAECYRLRSRNEPSFAAGAEFHRKEAERLRLASENNPPPSGEQPAEKTLAP